MRLSKFLTIIFFLLCPVFVLADFPERSDKLINDYAKVLGDVEGTEKRLHEFEKEASCRMIVVTMSVSGDLMEYANDLFAQWDVGGKEDRGILFLIDPEKNEGVLRLSYGLKSEIDQSLIDEIKDQGIDPAIIEGNYTGAISMAAKNLEKILKGDYNGLQGKKSNNWVFGLIFLFVATFVVLSSAYGRRDKRRVIYKKDS